MPTYTLTSTSCYAFARAIGDTIRLRFNGVEGVQNPHFFTQRSRFMRFIPTSYRRAELVARTVANLNVDPVQILAGN
ncbi:hypothetical protein OG21DRAFT_1516401 [Imleria badia]|nr:hypothetical protein OG21DRAFT_1516401 [Imleria badia]